ncbi:MAG: phospholipid carrier-dependent glycosyltransferase [Anaerolineae bacterium]
MFFTALALIAFLAIWLLLYSTPQGLSLSDDSIAYLAGAQSILSGQGYREAWLESNKPVTHFPPGFPALLALFGLAGLEPLRAARLVNALAYGLNAALLGWLGWRMARSYWVGLVLAVLFVLNAQLLWTHVPAMSEPLYIALSLLAIACFDRYFEQRQPGWLFITGVLTGWAWLVRYAGLALLATFLVAMVILGETRKKRLIGVLLILAGALPWLVTWTMRNTLIGGSATNRGLGWHPVTADNIKTGLWTVSNFLMPQPDWQAALYKNSLLLSGLVIAVLLVIFLGVVWVGLPRLFRPGQNRLPAVIPFVSGLYFWGYFTSILATMTFFDAATKFKLRILAPMYVSLLILLVAAGVWLWQRRSPLWKALVASLLLAWMALNLVGQLNAVNTLRRDPIGFASWRWYDSEILAALRALPAEIHIYTNEPGAVWLYTQRPARPLPTAVDSVTNQIVPAYAAEVQALRADVLSGKAVLALFRPSGDDRNVKEIYPDLIQGLYLAKQVGGNMLFTAWP